MTTRTLTMTGLDAGRTGTFGGVAYTTGRAVVDDSTKAGAAAVGYAERRGWIVEPSSVDVSPWTAAPSPDPETSALLGGAIVAHGNSWLVPDAGIQRAGAHWTQRLAEHLDATLTTHAVGGTRSGQIASRALNTLTPRDRAFLLATLIGNDRQLDPATAVGLSLERATRALCAAATADVRIPASTNAWSYSAGWQSLTNETAMGGKWIGSNTPGATATLRTTGVSVDVLAYASVDSGAVLRVTEGSTVLGTLDTRGGIVGNPTPTVLPIRGLGPGEHTLTVTLVSGIAYLEGALLPSAAPRLGLILEELPVDQARYDQTGGPVLAPADPLWKIVERVVADYPAIRAVQLDASGWDPARMSFDSLHPNDAGCAYIARHVLPLLLAVPLSTGIGNITTSADPYPAARPLPSPAPVPAGGAPGSAL